MNAIPLQTNTGTAVKPALCGSCLRVWESAWSANRCCICSFCGQHQDWSKGNVSHLECQRKRSAEVEFERYKKATMVTDWDGWVYLEGHGGQDGYHESLDSFLDHLENCEGDRPEYAWTCKEVRFPGIRLDNILENLTEEMFEDAYDSLNGTEDLQAAVDSFNTENCGLISYEPDYTKAVSIPPAEAA